MYIYIYTHFIFRKIHGHQGHDGREGWSFHIVKAFSDQEAGVTHRSPTILKLPTRKSTTWFAELGNFTYLQQFPQLLRIHMYIHVHTLHFKILS